MPIYEFRCPSCGHQFEELVFRASEVEELSCPSCGSSKIRKLMSTVRSGRSAAAAPATASGGCGGGGFT